ncbi:MAG: histidinol-phosphate aminotransferase family protein [Bacteroidetes bacterium]|nr:MAG: histidinol-phosphate aminotransferase family protein [Bacteroidota bacterium]
MNNELGRRHWLKQTVMAAAGLGLSTQIFGRHSGCAEDELPFNNSTNSPIRIGSNENPYGPSALAKAAMMQAVAKSNRYPWETTTLLRKKLGEAYGLSAEHVLMGAGSSELLGVISAFAGRQNGNAIAAYPTFKLWFTAAEHFGLTVKTVPLTTTKVHDLPAMLSAMDGKTRMVYVVNPHNPTGTVVAKAALESFVQEASKTAVVLLDEAYTEYSDEPSLAYLVANNKNVIVAKTFSKIHAMAGARIGYALAHPDTITQLADWQPWSNAGAGAVALAGAMASMDDVDFQRSCRQKNDAVKTFVTEALTQLGMQVIPSHTSFLYYNTGTYSADVAAITSAAGIVGVRTYEKDTPWRRTSIGTMDEMKTFIDVLKRGV